MRVKLLTLRFAPSLGGFDDRPLAEFVCDKEVLAVREHFFTVHDLPHLACLVTYQEPDSPTAATPSRREKPAPIQLTNAERVLFDGLREWRSERAREDGVPPYVILRNRELYAIVRTRPRTPNALQALDGIGPKKVERYGAEILSRLGGNGE